MERMYEKLLLLSHNNEKNNTYPAVNTYLTYGLGGALLLDLALMGRITIEKNIIIPVDVSKAKDVFLDEALMLMQNSKKPKNTLYWVNAFTYKIKKFKKRVYLQLSDNGIFRIEDKRFVGLFPYQSYVITRFSEKTQLSDRIRDILLHDEIQPSEEELLLISLLSACHVVDILVDKQDKKHVIKRAKSLAEGEKVGKAVLDSVNAAVSAAVHAAIMAGTTTTTSSN